MKTYLLAAVIAVCCPLATDAQIVIDQSDFANAGEVIPVKRAVNFEGDFITTGPNHTWNYSDMVELNSTSYNHEAVTNLPLLLNFAYGAPAISRYRASYRMMFTDLPIDQLSGILPVEFTDIYQYTKKETSKLTLIGYSATISGQGLPIKSDSIETKYLFPLEYGDSYVSNGYTFLDLSLIIDASWKQSRYRESSVDGWGTLNLPSGSYQVLRVKHRISETDSVSYQATNFGLQIPVRYEYEWIAKGKDLPVMKVTTSELAGTETVLYVEYIDFEALSINNQVHASLSIYPNPATEAVTIEGAAINSEIQILDLAGRKVLSTTVTSSNQHISTSLFKPGMYILQVGGESLPFIKK